MKTFKEELIATSDKMSKLKLNIKYRYDEELHCIYITTDDSVLVIHPENPSMAYGLNATDKCLMQNLEDMAYVGLCRLESQYYKKELEQRKDLDVQIWNDC